MKKIFALLLTTIMLFAVSVPVFADDVISPTATPVVTPSEKPEESPKTGDMNLLYVGVAGAALAATAVVAAVKSKKEA